MSIKVFLHYNVDGVIVYGCLLLLDDDVKDGGGDWICISVDTTSSIF